MAWANNVGLLVSRGLDSMSLGCLIASPLMIVFISANLQQDLVGFAQFMCLYERTNTIMYAVPPTVPPTARWLFYGSMQQIVI